MSESLSLLSGGGGGGGGGGDEGGGVIGVFVSTELWLTELFFFCQLSILHRLAVF